MNLRATLTQHPVGQGGLTSGKVEVPGGQFLWAYDCGSNQLDALNREIETLAGDGGLDFLFLSHLDSDHINGIDRLLARTSGVNEVVLPYLNDSDRLLAVADDISNGALSGSFLEFLVDTPRWLASRGVDRVTFIEPRTEGGGRDAPIPEIPRDVSGVGEGQVNPKWLHPRGHRPSLDTSSGNRAGGANIQRISTASSLTLHSGGGVLDWAFLPYAHSPPPEQTRVFRAELAARFGRSYRSKAFLADLLRDSQKRDALREAYESIWSDHNLVSMALYFGPISNAAWQGESFSYWTNSWRHFHRRNGAVGWLCTGDMNFRSSSRRKAFLTHYNQVLDQVNAFALPHHGSDRSFHREIPLALPRVNQCFAAAGPNGYGHPHKIVGQVVSAMGHQFLQVSDDAVTRLMWMHQRQ